MQHPRIPSLFYQSSLFFDIFSSFEMGNSFHTYMSVKAKSDVVQQTPDIIGNSSHLRKRKNPLYAGAVFVLAAPTGLEPVSPP